MKYAKDILGLIAILIMMILIVYGKKVIAMTGKPLDEKPAIDQPVIEPMTIHEKPAVNFFSSPMPVSGTGGFTLTSSAVENGGVLPVEYTCDGASATLPLDWKGAPSGTRSFALIMHHVASQEDVHWYWVLYDIPSDLNSLTKNSLGIGTLGNNSVDHKTTYAPPCSRGPGKKEYIYTLYALSSKPVLTVSASLIDRSALLNAIQNITLASAELHVTYTRESVNSGNSVSNAVATQTGDMPSQNSMVVPHPGDPPPQAAITACTGKKEQDSCDFTSQKGKETGVCEMVQAQLACSPPRGSGNGK